jgi:hypothetical protein
MPENRAVVRALSQRVLAEVASPDEAAVSASFIEPLIDMADSGEVVSVEAAEEPGGFGGNDLLVFVVVPVIVTVMGNIITEFGKLAIEELKGKLKQDKEAKAILVKITVRDVEAVVTQVAARTGSTRAKKKNKELRRRIYAAIIEYLDC